MSLNETQINPSLLYHSHEATDNLFRRLEHFLIISSNRNELIAMRQQGGILTSINGKCIKLISSSSINLSGLGRWN